MVYRNGLLGRCKELYILRYHGPPFAAEVAHIHFLEGSSDLGDVLRLERP